MGNAESSSPTAVAPLAPGGSSYDTPRGTSFTPVEDFRTGDAEVGGSSSSRTRPAGLSRLNNSSPQSLRSGGSPAAASPRLRPCLFGAHTANLKGEDGLRVDRVTIGRDVV